jgi:hypothetical protein
VQSSNQTGRSLFWYGLQGFALIQKYYEWKKSGLYYEFWKTERSVGCAMTILSSRRHSGATIQTGAQRRSRYNVAL